MTRGTDSAKVGISRAWVPALAAALLGSLVFAAYLVRLGHRYEEAAEDVRLDPAGLKVHASERAATPPERPLLVLFGDSRAAMWPAPEAAPYHVVNRGVGYQTTAQMLLRLDDDVARLRPDLVVLEAGVNDLKGIADFPARRAEIVADCEANLRRLVDRCRQAGAKVIVVTVFEIGALALWRRPFWSRDVSVAVSEVNAFLPSLTDAKVVLFDANRILDDGRGTVLSAFQLDHLHLNRAGYDALNRGLVPLVESLPR